MEKTMTREEKIERVKQFIETNNLIEEFCHKAIEEFRKYPEFRHDVYKTLCTFDIYSGSVLEIETCESFRNEPGYAYIEVPLSVFYDDNLEEYVAQQLEEKLKKERQREEEKKKTEKQAAIETIKQLKEKFNL